MVKKTRIISQYGAIGPKEQMEEHAAILERIKAFARKRHLPTSGARWFEDAITEAAFEHPEFRVEHRTPGRPKDLDTEHAQVMLAQAAIEAEKNLTRELRRPPTKTHVARELAKAELIKELGRDPHPEELKRKTKSMEGRVRAAKKVLDDYMHPERNSAPDGK